MINRYSQETLGNRNSTHISPDLITRGRHVRRVSIMARCKVTLPVVSTNSSTSSVVFRFGVKNGSDMVFPVPDVSALKPMDCEVRVSVNKHLRICMTDPFLDALSYDIVQTDKSTA